MSSATRSFILWALLAAAIAVPLIAATMSPLLEWRRPAYIVAGFAGIVALLILLIQPLLAVGLMPGISRLTSRRLHRFVGIGLVAAVILHVVGLWITSAPDVIDALLFVSPTPFSNWGVIAMWGVFATATIAGFRRHLSFSPTLWRASHKCLALIIVIGSVVHALLIEGTMEPVSKIVLCILVLLATTLAVANLWQKR